MFLFVIGKHRLGIRFNSACKTVQMFKKKTGLSTFSNKVSHVTFSTSLVMFYVFLRSLFELKYFGSADGWILSWCIWFKSIKFCSIIHVTAFKGDRKFSFGWVTKNVSIIFMLAHEIQLFVRRSYMLSVVFFSYVLIKK